MMGQAFSIIVDILTCFQFSYFLYEAAAGYLGRFQRAPGEIEKWQDQVQEFEDRIHSLEAFSSHAVGDPLESATRRAQDVASKSREFTREIFGNSVKLGFRQQWAWLRSQERVNKLRESLKDAQDALCIAQNTRQMISMDCLESNWAVVTHQATPLTALCIDEGADVVKTDSAYGYYQRTDQLHERSYSRGHTRCSSTAHQHRHFEKHRSAKQDARHNEGSLRDPKCQLRYPSNDPSSKANRALRPAYPSSCFEMSCSFRPEAYTVADATPALQTHSAYQVTLTKDIQVTRFGIFYRKQPGKWIRLTVRIRARVGSQSWSVDEQPSLDSSLTSSSYFPPSLVAPLTDSLKLVTDIEQNSCFELSLGKDVSAYQSRILSPLTRRWSIAPQFKSCLEELTNRVNHLGCNQVIDRALVRLPLTRRPSGLVGGLFIANFRGRWYKEYRFGFNKAQIDAIFYVLKVLHCLQGELAITPLVSVVVDEDTRLVDAFLCELPAKGRMCYIIAEANRLRKPIAWARKETWCWQITRAVATMHSKGFVVGALGDRVCSGFAVNADDNAVLYGRLRERFRWDRDALGAQPPEYNSSVATARDLKITPASEIYQLGHLLWSIAAGITGGGVQRMLCKRVGCGAVPGCAEPHAGPVELPPPEDSTPVYLIAIIAACRHKDPMKRPTAQELLAMFPTKTAHCKTQPSRPLSGEDDLKFFAENFTSHESQPFQSQKQDRCQSKLTMLAPSTYHPQTARIEDIIAIHGLLVLCSFCNVTTASCYYHCSVCLDSDFNICQQCLDEGEHCFVRTHTLQKVIHGQPNMERYSCINVDGRRNISVC